MKRYLLLISVFYLGVSTFSQNTILDTGHRSSNKKKIFYSSIGGSILLDQFQSPVFNKLSLNHKYNTKGFALASFTLDLRFNVWAPDTVQSVSVNFPLSVAFGPVLSASNLEVINTDRIGNLGYICFPVLFQYNKGCHSVSNNKNTKGITTGVGVQLIYAPIFFIDGINNNYKRSWILPIIKIGYKQGKRTTNRYIDFTGGILNGWYFKASYGFLLGM